MGKWPVTPKLLGNMEGAKLLMHYFDCSNQIGVAAEWSDGRRHACRSKVDDFPSHEAAFADCIGRLSKWRAENG